MKMPNAVIVAIVLLMLPLTSPGAAQESSPEKQIVENKIAGPVKPTPQEVASFPIKLPNGDLHNVLVYPADPAAGQPNVFFTTPVPSVVKREEKSDRFPQLRQYEGRSEFDFQPT